MFFFLYLTKKDSVNKQTAFDISQYLLIGALFFFPFEEGNVGKILHYILEYHYCIFLKKQR